MNLHDLEAFVSIAQLGGVTRAAGQLHRSQPAITRRIKILEHQLGVPLLERGRNGALLTDAGRIAGCSCPDALMPKFLGLGVQYFHSGVNRLLQSSSEAYLRTMRQAAADAGK